MSRWSSCDFPVDVDGTDNLSLSLLLRPFDVEGDDFSKCLSSASLIRFRSSGPPTISDFDDPPPLSLYMSSFITSKIQQKKKDSQTFTPNMAGTGNRETLDLARLIVEIDGFSGSDSVDFEDYQSEQRSTRRNLRFEGT